MENREITFEIKESIAELTRFTNGWTKELNVVAWNGGDPKYDIRDWSPDHEHMSRGITLKAEEMKGIIEALKDRDLQIQAPKVKDSWER